MALRVPISWLNDYIQTDLTPQALAERLTLGGLEVESITALGADWDRETVKVGTILEVAPHPNADRLCLVTVDHGGAAPLQVVTGAPNVVRYVKEGLPETPLKVPFATVGAVLIDGHAEVPKPLKLKPSKIRGVESRGMVCSERELGLSDEHEGILFLPADAPSGTPLVDYLGDHILEFDIKGGFAHLLSVVGIAREIQALTGGTPRRKVLEDIATAEAAGTRTATPSYLQLEVADPELCSRYVGLLIEGITVQPSPFWLQQCLNRVGQRPINAVVDATNYVMLELGQPLHAFDYDTLRPEREDSPPLIRVRRATSGETLRTLDGKLRTFDNQMLLITDGGGPVGVAGVMGGQESEVSGETTRILLEAANFEFLNNRRTSQLLKLRTEASDRFGKDLDPAQCLQAALRCAHLITEFCGGSVRTEYGDLYLKLPEPYMITLRPQYVRHLLGVSLTRDEIAGILESLEFAVTGDDPLQVTPPSYRKDVTQPADLAEEVGRVYGYDRMPATLIEDALPPQRRNRLLEGNERIRDLILGCGLDEIITYSITSREDEQRLDPAWREGSHPTPTAEPAEPALALLNPLDAERGHLRRNLLPGMLRSVQVNLRYQSRVSLFEIGRVFHPRQGEILPDEPWHLGAVLTGCRDADSWLVRRERPHYDFFDIKGIAETLVAGMWIGTVEWTREAPPHFHPGRSASLRVAGEQVGHLGELHPRVVAAFGLPQQAVCTLELNLAPLLAHWNEDKQMVPISHHPPVHEDLAFIVDAELHAEQVRAMIAQTGRPLLRNVMLFDDYRDSRIGKGKKSLAYALTYQADDRTLTDKEVGKVRDRIARRLQKELDAQLRSN